MLALAEDVALSGGVGVVDVPHLDLRVLLLEPSQENRKGDVRFGCESAGCELKGGHTVFVQIFGGHGTPLDECRLMLDSATKHEWPLAGAAAGTEICMKDDKGNIGLYVIQTKSTALPDLAFLQGDLTVWRNADR
ncbi:hypothetical protein ACFYNN_21020 [Streptomyces sp. NPDC006978]|uniref:hypothetical protein n=1 Tax=Streptomyces sp. NPDC006978 TaxID=3364769 RepID=UPI00369369CB